MLADESLHGLKSHGDLKINDKDDKLALIFHQKDGNLAEQL